jgi:hypothetical protein
MKAMPAANGTRCPMHGGDQACRMSGTCGGPMSALFALLSNHAILTASPSISPAFDAAHLAVVTPENLVVKLVPPDPPPPRG